MVTWISFQNHLLEVGTKPGDRVTPNAHNHWFILFYHVWGPTWKKIHWNGIWLRAWTHTASHYTWGSGTTLHAFGGVLGRPLDTFHLGSHNFMVTALGSCVKWPSYFRSIGHNLMCDTTLWITWFELRCRSRSMISPTLSYFSCQVYQAYVPTSIF